MSPDTGLGYRSDSKGLKAPPIDVFKIFLGICISIAAILMMATLVGLPIGLPVLFVGGCITLYGVLELVGRTLGLAGKKRCPHCAERIQRRAQVCKHCGRDV